MKMKALRFNEFGPPSVLSLTELDAPELAAGQALVEVHASAINPSDVKNVAGLFQASLPRIPGRDYAGVVVAGEGWRGKEVWGTGQGLGMTRDGAHAQYLAVELESLSLKPAALSMEQAATVGVPYLTAWASLVDAGNVQAGETVLVTGADGAVGRAAIQVARWKGAKVIGVVREAAASEADVLINTKTKDFVVEARALTAGKGVDLVLDTVGGPIFEQCLRSLRPGGRQLVMASAGSGRVEFSLRDFYHQAHQLIGIDTMKISDAGTAQIMNALRAGFEEGVLRPSAVQVWPLAQAVEAYTVVEKRLAKTKQVLLPRR